MLSSHEEVCERYTRAGGGLIKALMVDEFQDTSPVQKRILWKIAPQSNELFIIGDAKQWAKVPIIDWRGVPSSSALM